MSQINCESCQELRDTSPEFATNGVTTNVATSLQNDTGFNPNANPAHTDCEDLLDANDCLVGRMDGEVETYDVCDWKPFMHKFLPNLYEVIKAGIYSICGIWKNIHDLWDFARDICSKVDNVMIPGGAKYGTFPYNDGASSTVVTMGEFYKKNGQPLLIPWPREEIINPDYRRTAGAGLQIDVKESSRCEDGACRKYVWTEPWFYETRISEETALGDILWYVKTDELVQKTGVPTAYLETFRKNVPGDTGHGGGWVWRGGITMADGKDAWIWAGVDPTNELGENYFVLQYVGSSYPNSAPSNTQDISSDQGISFKTYSYSC